VTADERAVWFFDVDGCLVDSMSGSSLRPLAREILTALRERGAAVVWWSAGGAEHARAMALAHAVTDLVDGFLTKERRDADGRWSVADLPEGCRPHVCVDDRPEELPQCRHTFAVWPYLAPDEHDHGLREIHDLVTKTEYDLL
jgi:hypothetical protein